MTNNSRKGSRDFARSLQDTLQNFLQTYSNVVSAGVTPASDTNNVQAEIRTLNASTGRVEYGVVRSSVPHFGSYIVSVDNGGLAIGRDGGNGDFESGGREHRCLAPGTGVYMFVESGSAIGTILCTVPAPQPALGDSFCDTIAYGSGVGFYVSPQYSVYVGSLKDAGGAKLLEGDRPLDALTGDWGIFATSGVGVHVDAEMAFLRTSEICGLYLFRDEGFARLSGESLGIESQATRSESGVSVYECYDEAGHSIYPWEAAGLTSPDASVPVTERGPKAIFEGIYGPVEPTNADICSINRIETFNGYLGQGQLLVMSSPQGDGVNTLSTPVTRHGLLREQKMLDGTYLLEARQIFLAKTADVPVIRRKAERDVLLEDQSYRYSGLIGVGDEPDDHIVKALDSSDPNSLLFAEELYSYVSGWQGLNAAIYNPNVDIDYRPQTSAAPEIDLSQSDRAELPDPEKVKIDHRLDEVDFYRILSFIAVLPQGGIAIRDGMGGEIKLQQGAIDITGLSVHINGAKFVTLFGSQVAVRSQGDVEIVSSTGDVRVKADVNLNMLGGNRGQGGVLIESRSTSIQSDWLEDPAESIGSGIVLKSANSHVSLLAGDVMIKTGGGNSGLRGGPIVLDAGSQHPVITRGRSIIRYSASKFTDCFGAGPASIRGSNVSEITYTRFNGAVGVDGQLIVTGNVQAEYGFNTTRGHFSSVKAKDPRFRFVSIDQNQGLIDGNMNDLRAKIKEGNKDGAEELQKFREKYETNRGPVDPQVISNASFGFPSSTSYGASGVTISQPFWQRSIGASATRWTEPTVRYRKNVTRPWPGNQRWTNENGFIAIDPDAESRYFNHVTSMPIDAQDKDNRKKYEEAFLSSAKPTSLESGFRTVRVN